MRGVVVVVVAAVGVAARVVVGLLGLGGGRWGWGGMDPIWETHLYACVPINQLNQSIFTYLLRAGPPEQEQGEEGGGEAARTTEEARHLSLSLSWIKKRTVASRRLYVHVGVGV